MDNDNRENFISPIYHKNVEGKSWLLLKTYIRFLPMRAAEVKSKHKLCFYREIAYLNEKKNLDGIGKSWIPINKLGTKIYLSCFSKEPKPLGVVLKDKYRSTMRIVKKKDIDMILSPYRIDKENILYLNRIITINNLLDIYIEEHFVKSEAVIHAKTL
jgi:hypothetical protein